MKKTSTRLATIGGAIILGAFGIVLAQHDSRKRDRASDFASTVDRKAAQPITPDHGFASGGLPGTDAASEQPDYPAAGSLGAYTDTSAGLPIVRGNNDDVPFGLPPAAEYKNANPLRSDLDFPVGSDTTYAGDVVLASAMGDTPESEYPALPTGLPTTPQAFGQQPTSATAGLPSPAGLPFPSGGNPGPSVALQTQQNFPAPASLPTTMPGTGITQAERSALPTDNYGSSTLPAQPIGSTRSISDMSDTQYGSMAPTDLTTPTSPVSRVGFSQPQTGYADNTPAARPPAPATGSGGFVPTGMTALPSPGLSAVNNTAYPSIPSAAPSQPLSAAPTTFPMSASGAAPSGVIASLVSDVPGNRYLDGAQTPSVSIEIQPPGEETQVGKKATFVIRVSNQGNVDAHDVTVVDKVPQLTRFVDSEPAVTPTRDNLLQWSLGTVPAGEERVIRVNLVPLQEGEIGSTATVRFATMASVRTLATQPKLQLMIEALPQVLIGSPHRLIMQIKNVGSGVARNVELIVDVPDTLSHVSGVSSISARLGDLHPNESRPVDNLAFTAAQPGKAMCTVTAKNADGVLAQESVEVDVRAPQLTAEIQGPKERYLQRQARYTLSITNIGTASATNLDFAVHLPAGLKYVESDRPEASYDRARHTVHVGMEELPAGSKAPFQILLMPVELGNQAFSIKATGDLGLAAEATSQVTVKGRAELEFTITQDNGSIEVGATTTYEVQIMNKGDKPDRNVQLEIALPEGSELVKVSPQVQVRQNGNVVQFEPVAEMPIRDSRTYRFEVRHNTSGTRLIRSRLMSENLTVGVLKEVPTFVYDDGE